MNEEAALLHASWKGDVQHVAQLLLLKQRPADVDAVDVTFQDELGWNALHWAAGDGHENVVRLLLHYCNLKLNNTTTTTTLIQATTKEFGSTPLHRAADNGHGNVVRVLLEAAAAAAAEDKDKQDTVVNAQRRDGLTALHQACHKRHVPVIRLLLDHGAHALIKAKNGKTPLDLVMETDTREKQQETMAILELFANQNKQKGTSTLVKSTKQVAPFSSLSTATATRRTCSNTLDKLEWTQQQQQQGQQQEEKKLGDCAEAKNVPIFVPTVTVAAQPAATIAATVVVVAQPAVAAPATTGANNKKDIKKNDDDDDDDWNELHQAVHKKRHVNVIHQATSLVMSNNKAYTLGDDKHIVKDSSSLMQQRQTEKNNNKQFLGDLEDKAVPVPTLVVQEAPLPTLADSSISSISSINSKNKSTITWTQKLQQQENEITTLQKHIAKLQVALDDKVSRETVQQLLIDAAQKTKILQDHDDEAKEKKNAAYFMMMQQHYHDSSSTIMLLEAKLGRLNTDMEDMLVQFETFLQEKLAHHEHYHDQMIQQSLAAANTAIDECYDKAYHCNNLLSAVILLLVLYTAIGSWMAQRQCRFRQQQEKTKKRDIITDHHLGHPKRQEMDVLFHALLHCYAKLDAEQRTTELALILNSLFLNNRPVAQDDDDNNNDTEGSSRGNAAPDGSMGTRMVHIAALHKCAQEQQQQQATTAATTATGEESSCLDIEDDDSMPSLMEPEIMYEDEDNNNDNNIKEDKCVVSWNTTLETIESDDSHDFELVADHHSTTTSSWSEQQEESSSSSNDVITMMDMNEEDHLASLKDKIEQLHSLIDRL